MKINSLHTYSWKLKMAALLFHTGPMHDAPLVCINLIRGPAVASGKSPHERAPRVQVASSGPDTELCRQRSSFSVPALSRLRLRQDSGDFREAAPRQREESAGQTKFGSFMIYDRRILPESRRLLSPDIPGLLMPVTWTGSLLSVAGSPEFLVSLGFHQARVLQCHTTRVPLRIVLSHFGFSFPRPRLRENIATRN